MEEKIKTIEDMFWKTRADRLEAKTNRGKSRNFLEFDALTASIREIALLDVLSVLDYSKDKIESMRRINGFLY